MLQLDMNELHLNTNVHLDFISDFKQNKEKSWIYVWY